MELDWTRFWWDVVSNGHGLDFADATQIYQDAESYSWCANGNTTLTCPDVDRPAKRVQQAFGNLGFGAAYNAEKNNGVTQ